MRRENALDRFKATLDEPETIEIVISGPRTEVNMAKKGEFRATVDVSNCDYGENTEAINVTFPEGVSGINIKSMSERNAKFTVE